MACSVALPSPVLHLLGRNKLSYLWNPCVSMPNLGYCLRNQIRFRRLSSVDGNNTGNSLADSDSFSFKPEDSSGSDGGKADTVTSNDGNETLKKLKRYGIAGLLSYGLLNTVYYLTTFLFVWFYFSPAPGKMGYLAAAQRFLKIMAMVWAGSQVTKLIRAGGALALAPFVDRGLSWFTDKFHFESKGKAFAAIVGVCFGLALVLFFAVTLLSA